MVDDIILIPNSDPINDESALRDGLRPLPNRQTAIVATVVGHLTCDSPRQKSRENCLLAIANNILQC